eukprot:scaffold7293_cov126-Isochrysis_galbana.AAC.1
MTGVVRSFTRSSKNKYEHGVNSATDLRIVMIRWSPPLSKPEPAKSRRAGDHVCGGHSQPHFSPTRSSRKQKKTCKT